MEFWAGAARPPETDMDATAVPGHQVGCSFQHCPRPWTPGDPNPRSRNNPPDFLPPSLRQAQGNERIPGSSCSGKREAPAPLATPAPGSSSSRPHPAHPSLGALAPERTPSAAMPCYPGHHLPVSCHASRPGARVPRSAPPLILTQSQHSEPHSHNLPLFREHTAEGT